jgi:mRNA interferase RelE/StbE
VKFRIEKSFDRDIDRIKDKKVLRTLGTFISLIENAQTIRDIPHIKKIEGYGSYYRMKIGDYRLGMEAASVREVVLLRFLHRETFTDISQRGKSKTRRNNDHPVAFPGEVSVLSLSGQSGLFGCTH